MHPAVYRFAPPRIRIEIRDHRYACGSRTTDAVVAAPADEESDPARRRRGRLGVSQSTRRSVGVKHDVGAAIVKCLQYEPLTTDKRSRIDTG